MLVAGTAVTGRPGDVGTSVEGGAVDRTVIAVVSQMVNNSAPYEHTCYSSPASTTEGKAGAVFNLPSFSSALSPAACG